MEAKTPTYRFDDVRVDPANFRVWKGETPVQIEPKAFQVLLFLIENRDRLIEKRELLDTVWKDTFVTENALTRSVALLRKLLSDNVKEAKYIETVPTRGYRFVANVEVLNGQETSAPAPSQPQPATAIPSPVPPNPTVIQSKPRLHMRRPVLLIVLLCLAAYGVLLLNKYFNPFPRSPGPSASTPRMVRRVTQITAWSRLDDYPSLSPDGGSLAYSSDHDGNFELYVKPLASGGREIQLTADGQQNFEPDWSPDGQYIAYHSRNRGGIWIVPALGGNSRRLTEFGSKPAWSRDSSTIAFQSGAPTDINAFNYGTLPPSTIWTISAKGGQPTQITQSAVPAGGHSTPTWAPDGKRIAFFAYDSNGGPLWTVSSQGGDLKPLTLRQTFIDPVYAPDGKSLYCVGNASNVFGVWKIPFASPDGDRLGDPVEVLSADTQPIRHLSISADGKKIAYSVRSLTSDVWSVPVSPESGQSTGPAVPLLQDRSQRKTNPAISPDGKKIAIDAWRSGGPVNVWLLDPDGKNPAPLITSATGNELPGWLSNDELAYVAFHQDQPATIAATNLRTGTERTLFTLARDMDFMRLSPDGKQLSYNSEKSGTINVWKVALAGGPPVQLTFDQELTGWPCWSPDGRLLALEMKRGDDTHLGIISSDGGPVTQLTFERGQSWPHTWSPQGDKIAFAGFRNGVWNVWWVSIKDKSQKQLTNFTKLNSYVRYPTWSPLGNQIVFEYAEMTGNVWMMELK